MSRKLLEALKQCALFTWRVLIKGQPFMMISSGDFAQLKKACQDAKIDLENRIFKVELVAAFNYRTLMNVLGQQPVNLTEIPLNFLGSEVVHEAK